MPSPCASRRRRPRPTGRSSRPWPARVALEPTALGRIEGAIGQALDRVFGLFDVLALVAVVVAALGIVNTLTMNVFERVREIGVLRAAGMTRRQVWRSVVVEAGITGLVGAICGVVAGLLVGALMVVLAGGRLEIATAVPWPAVGGRVGAGRGPRDARGRLSGPPRERRLDRACRRVRIGDPRPVPAGRRRSRRRC